MRDLSSSGLSGVTLGLRARLAAGESADALAPEAFAAVCEAVRRTLDLSLFDVQIMGGAALHFGSLVEMKTGEGKTLTATLPAYLHALGGAGVHVVTADDYLASRDAAWTAPVFQALGLECRVIGADMDSGARADAYAADITYGTCYQFGYDYLRDNLADREEERVHRRSLAIVDEADLILIDEAQASLLITRPGVQQAGPETAQRLAERLRAGEDYVVDARTRSVTLTDRGTAGAESMLGADSLFSESNLDMTRLLIVALKAKEHYTRDVDYIVEDGAVRIVDELTGRYLQDRRYNGGLHEAIEAKEGLPVGAPRRILSRMDVADYLRGYPKLTAMTGVASTETEAYRRIYGLEVVSVPTRLPVARVDEPVAIYPRQEGKRAAIIREVRARHATGQPILIGTASVADSERISRELTDHRVVHQVLNAKHHDREAAIIAEAGRFGAVTVVTKMAGRGVDISLGGGDPADRELVLGAGGLYVLGVGLPETRRLELHLRGRSGRQGDPGRSAYIVALDDDEVRRAFNSAVLDFVDRRKWVTDDVDAAFDTPRITRGIERSLDRLSARQEALLLSWRQFAAVESEQRERHFADRRAALEGTRLHERVRSMLDQTVIRFSAAARDAPDGRRLLRAALAVHYPVGMTLDEMTATPDAELVGLLRRDIQAAYDRREAEVGPATLRALEVKVALNVLDRKWADHLETLDDLMENLGLRTLHGGAPLAEFRKQAHLAFAKTQGTIEEDTVGYLFNIDLDGGPE